MIYIKKTNLKRAAFGFIVIATTIVSLNVYKNSLLCKSWPYKPLGVDDVVARLNNLTWNSTSESETFKHTFAIYGAKFKDYEIVKNKDILPHSARVVARKIFKTKPLVIWATEWHMTPIKDLEYLLKPFGVVVLNYNLDPYRCQWQDCEKRKNLKVLTGDNVLEVLSPTPEKFSNVYKDDAEMKSVDVVFCGYPASLCEIYLSLNKSVLVIPSTRYDVGRYTVERWNNLNKNLQTLAEKPWNVFGGNNLYDAKYLQYYTGIKAQHIPSMCDYTGAEYTNTINEFIVFRRRDNCFNKLFFNEVYKACEKIKCSAKLTLLQHYNHDNVAKYRAVVHVPYQISVMSIFEQYRMNIPMFFPSPELLSRWQVDHYIMPERSFNGAFFGERPKASIIPAHSSQTGIPDPKNEHDYNSTRYWMEFADFYQIMPYGIIYDSIPHLVAMLQSVTDHQLNEISKSMRYYNIRFKKKLISKWKHILLEYAKNSPNKPY